MSIGKEAGMGESHTNCLPDWSVERKGDEETGELLVD